MITKPASPFYFLLTISIALASCNPFAPESRQLGSGYRLKRVRDSKALSLTIPHEGGGIIIDEIGWEKPLIIARSAGSLYWIVIDTSRAQRTQVSDTELRTDARFQKVRIEPVAAAWERLQPDRPLW